MQLMLAYRFLRKISGWTMEGFYSEVHVSGQENMPKDGPIILAATHHNEIIDIAALSVTIPHQRRICYWAKSTMFKNPLSGALLRSSGSIPVYRNPNNIGSRSGSGSATSQADLFKHTTAALAKGEVVGVFPEGTSYSEPAIVQIKEGAAWAAVEYVKARVRGKPGKDLIIVPAAVVYTDKSQYQSQVIVRYGKPIHVDGFLADVDLDDDDSVRMAVKDITGQIYQQLKEMTINAPDWDTYNSARIAATLARGKLPSSEERVRILQLLAEFFSRGDQEIQNAKRSLVKYLGLLHYTGISHAALDYIYPLPLAATSTLTAPTIFLTVLSQLCKTFLHPHAIAFLPVFILHLPMYITGWLAARFLTIRDEEESKAQFKAIFGGAGMGLPYGMLLRLVYKAFGGEVELVQRLTGTLVVSLGTVRILWKWHNFLVKGNLERWRCLSASVKILVGLILPASNALSEERLEAYLRPPPPAENPFVARATTTFTRPLPVNPMKLVRPLLAARADVARRVKVVRRDTRGGASK